MWENRTNFESFGQAVYDTPKTVDDRNAALYTQYKALAEQEKSVLFGGRLAEYKYYDMAPTIEQALRLAKSELEQWIRYVIFVLLRTSITARARWRIGC